MTDQKNGSKMSLRLKSLELSGYKTFANKTKFEFDGNITVVVGPNGSGKSNVADSLRWVLGEQSFGLLRGRKTEDMIFSGSEIKPRASRASATVTFDNSEGWLPIDFAEVSVTRRAYRDGQNEYLINNQKVRLRDVTELLSKSGLAERTYTIIGQGLVDAALSIKAEERRRLFEEAAGIGLYRSRKRQTIRRLETTTRNIDRVKDILAELEPRLKSLEKQARRAVEYDQIRNDLEAVLREWYGYHWHRTQNELVEARKTQEAQDATLEAARKNQEATGQRLAELRDGVNTMRAQLSSWHRQLSQLHQQREEASRDLAVKGERNRSLNEQRHNLENEILQLAQDEQIQAQETQQATAQMDEMRDQVTEAEEALEKAEKSLEERGQERKRLEELLEKQQAELTELEGAKMTAAIRIEQLNKQFAQNSDSKAEIMKALAETGVALTGSKQGKEDAEAVFLVAEQAGTDIQAELGEQREKSAALEEERKQRQIELQGLEKAYAQGQAEFEVLIQAETKLTGYAAGAKALLETGDSVQGFDILGTLNDKMNVPEELEAAVAAVLGDFLDAILVENKDEAEKALMLLEEQPGKAAILPLGALKSEVTLQAPEDEGCLGVALDLVDAPAELRPALDVLLGQVLVVKDRKAAQRILPGQPSGCQVVTLRGEVFSGDGKVLANAGGGVEILSRTRRHQELEKELENLEGGMTVVNGALFELDNQEMALRTEIGLSEDALESTKQEQEQKRNELQSKLLEVEQVQSAFTWYEKQLGDVDEDIRKGEKQIEEISSGREEDDARGETLVKEIEACKGELAAMLVDELQREVSHWEKQLAVKMQALENRKQRVGERQTVLDAILARKTTLQQRKNQIDRQLSEIKDQVENMHDSEGDVAGEIGEIQGLIGPTEEELKGLEDQLRTVEEEEGAVRKNLSQAERINVKTQVGLARRQEAFESLRERIEDDFGLVAFDYEQEVSGPTPLPMGALIEHLPVVTELSAETEDTLKRYRSQLRRMGAINPEARKEYEEVKERYEFLSKQLDDLEKAEIDITEVIAELDILMDREFRKTFEEVAGAFRTIFGRLFSGGSARLVLTDEENMGESGVDIEARLPGKRMQRLALLSGGERTMTAVALIFALLKTSPTPFCVLDEVDAALDETNTERLRELLLEFGEQIQFVVITHNRDTVQAADLIYGITMGRDTTSQMISLRLDDVDERYSD